MGRKKKFFIDKKNSATFRLLARDTSTFPAAVDASTAALPSSDRVFVRVDTNQFQVRGIFDDDDEEYHHVDPEPSGKKRGDDVNSIFADAPGETDDEEDSFSVPWPSHVAHVPKERASHPLPDEARREILELGLPDDGYNYLQHLREISNRGGGSAYYENSKARFDLVPLDVKAYDASRVKIRGGESKKDPIYAVASKSVGVKVQKVVDPDVVRLLDDSDMSRFGSDVEDLDEDFVFKANLPDGNEGENEEVEAAESGDEAERKMSLTGNGLEKESLEKDGEDELHGGDKPRIHRLLDEQFDLLALQEYNDDSGYDDDGYMDMISESLDEKLHDSLKDCKVDDLEVEGQYRVHGDYVYEQEEPGIGIQLDASTDVIRRCREYAEKYCNENEDDEEIFEVVDSSDESEIWDCETIVSTYSNLDNHPGKIQAPENSKKKVVRNLPVDSIKKTDMIELRGKEKLRVDFLSCGKKNSENLKKPIDTSFEKQKIRTSREESKDMKKERKAAVKVERREARRVKKELKGLYRCESHKAQKVASLSMPSAIHLM